jgi:hypothetical protein
MSGTAAFSALPESFSIVALHTKGEKMSLPRLTLAGILTISAFSGWPAIASAAAPALTHVRGTIEKVTPTTLTIATTGGPVDVGLAKSTGIVGAAPASFSDIKPNEFIGVTNVPRAGSPARALGVFILPDAFRSSQSGSFAWDFPSAGTSGSRMTNGTISQGSRMTNGTVSSFSQTGPLTVTLAYPGGSINTTIPSNTPVVRVEPASVAILKPGAHVFAAVASASGHPTAAQIVVGENGVTPPM